MAHDPATRRFLFDPLGRFATERDAELAQQAAIGRDVRTHQLMPLGHWDVPSSVVNDDRGFRLFLANDGLSAQLHHWPDDCIHAEHVPTTGPDNPAWAVTTLNLNVDEELLYPRTAPKQALVAAGNPTAAIRRLLCADESHYWHQGTTYDYVAKRWWTSSAAALDLLDRYGARS